ncbi:hypothetical protein [Gaopeijia maritima]|uniref:DUF4390 domain-containing protein n=1 Tax=Gaopeijia maritima TaxID=3119007 RepID=A0ABU9E6V8_9BACT
MRRFLLLTILASGLALGLPSGVSAQDETWISVVPETGAARVEVGALLDDRALANAMHEGLPLRIGVSVELWADRFFDSEEGREEWKASVVYDPVTLDYEVQVGDRDPARLRSLTQVREHLQRAFVLMLRPHRAGRYYYLATVEMATLSLSDLDELRRWLSGDLASGTQGDSEGAVTRGVRRLFVRALGLPTRRLRLRTDAFDFEGAPSN